MLAAGKDPGDPKQNKKGPHGGAELRAAARQMAAQRMAARRQMGQMEFENGTLCRLQADFVGGS